MLLAFFITYQVASYSVAEVATFSVGERNSREACPYRNAVGALSDALELLCEEDHEERFNPLHAESFAIACCPEPYKPCDVSERVPGCDDLIIPHLAVRGDSL